MDIRADTGRHEGGELVSTTQVPDKPYVVGELPRTGPPRSKPARLGPARFVLIAWGNAYVERLLRFTIPATLAPGNLPYLVDHLDCEITIVTESKYFDYLASHPTMDQLRQYCAVRLVSLDDLLQPQMYGLVLTLGNFRGFEDLGERMVDTYLMFIFTDFILGADSFRTLVDKIEAGERLIMAPSYRVLAHQVEPELSFRMDYENWSLTVPNRQMAKLILDNRHYTIRAKTINQRLFNIDLFEQFYIQVDPNTLICRQNPFALVCMRPEQPIYGMETFWDYGIISEACPNTRICALNDTDDFVMLELQDETPAHEHDYLRLGWELKEDIATRFNFTTNDHRTLGQFTLYLHSEDLPPETAEAEKKLEHYVSHIHWASGPTRPHRRHEYWLGQWNHLNYLRDQEKTFLAWTDPTSNMHVTYQDGFTGSEDQPAVLQRPGRSMLRRVYERVVGFPPNVSRWHAMWADLRQPMELLRDALARGPEDGIEQKDCLVVMTRSDEGWIGKKPFFSVPGNHVRCAASTVRSKFLPDDFFGDRQFYVAYCELAVDDLVHFSKIYNKIRPHMRKGGEIIVFFFAEERNISETHIEDFLVNGCPFGDESDIWFIGTPLHRWIVLQKCKLRSVYSMNNWIRRIAIVGFALISLPLSLYENMLDRNKPSYGFVEWQSSVIMRFKVL